MSIADKYDHLEAEKKWYDYWMKNEFFKSTPDSREPYTIVIPPPNVTGVLHMGHMLNNTIQDILVRRARMRGYNACWVPGTDHASIATEAKVVAKLKDEGIDKKSLSRDQFMKHAWEWKEKHGGIILEQLKKLGASCDWDRTSFTMDEHMSESVIKVFVDLYNKGLIYRGVRMVNWDPAAKTALSDEEVIHKEVNSKLYYVKYFFADDSGEFLTIATTRPETILGDTALCVNPNDDRYKNVVGKTVKLPLLDREIPVIADEYVDMEFGTGCLKITPAHDINDYEIGLRHNLPSIDTFNDDGTLSEAAQMFVGKDRFEVRKLMEKELENSGNLVKVEAYNNKVGYSERTNVAIEPKLSAQWFLKMEDIAKPALQNVENDTVKYHPAKFKNVYRHWMENIKDWCISRQLWWGQRIPVYYLQDGSYVVATNADEALKLAQQNSGNNSLTMTDLRQDEDVMDTWFSSWLWPMSVFDGVRNPENPDYKYYYPTNDLVTGQDIIFFWVARMIMAGYEFEGKQPFKNVYFTGMVRDEKGRKMSKQLGNSPDCLKLIDKYSADGVRLGMLICAPSGNDLLFDEALPEQGRSFNTKLWNSFKLIKSWEVDETITQPEHSALALKWFGNKLSESIKEINTQFDEYRISSALMSVYTLIRDEFSGWLLEIIKPAYQQPIDSKTIKEVNAYLDSLLRILHPFMPFISEEIWQNMEKRKEGESIMIAEWTKVGNIDTELLSAFEDAKETVTGIRNVRTSKGIAMKDALPLNVKQGGKGYDESLLPVITKLANIDKVETVSDDVQGAASFLVKTTTFYIPLGNLINVEEEVQKLEEELKYNKGFLNSVMKKLSNEKFVSGAPEAVVAKEQAKKADTEAKIAQLEAQIASLKG